MSKDWKTLGEEGLVCFGAISASVSHELRNAVAIVYENAGLLQDFCALANEEKPLDPKRIEALSHRILEQIRRADRILQDLNWFSHTVDDPVRSVPLEEMVQMAVALFARPASARGVSLESAAPAKPLSVTTNPFLLFCLLWFCLLQALEHAAETRKIRFEPVAGQDHALIRLWGVGPPGGEGQAGFPQPRERAIMEAIEARITVEPENQAWVIALPWALSGPSSSG